MLRLRELRKAQKISQRKLADYVGVTQAALSGWENEKFEINQKSLAKLADFFGVSIDYLLGRTHETEYKVENRFVENRFKEQRIKHGFKNQKELATILSVNQTAVSQWERGATTPSTDMLVTLSELYDVSIDYLLGRSDEIEKKESFTSILKKRQRYLKMI